MQERTDVCDVGLAAECALFQVFHPVLSQSFAFRERLAEDSEILFQGHIYCTYHEHAICGDHTRL